MSDSNDNKKQKTVSALKLTASRTTLSRLRVHYNETVVLGTGSASIRTAADENQSLIQSGEKVCCSSPESPSSPPPPPPTTLTFSICRGNIHYY